MDLGKKSNLPNIFYVLEANLKHVVTFFVKQFTVLADFIFFHAVLVNEQGIFDTFFCNTFAQ